MITVFIFSDRPHRYAFTKQNDGSNLPKEGYNKWKYVETKNYKLDDFRFPLLPFSSNDLSDKIDDYGYHLVDLKLFDQF